MSRLSFVVLSALLAHAFAAGQSTAGPVNGPAGATAKNEEIEKAGEKMGKGDLDGAFKHLQEAVKKDPTLPPARLMMSRLCLSSKELSNKAGRCSNRPPPKTRITRKCT